LKTLIFVAKILEFQLSNLVRPATGNYPLL